MKPISKIKYLTLICSAILYLIAIVFISCSKKSETIAPNNTNTGIELSGGECTTFDQSFNAFGHAFPNLTITQNTDFVVGNSFAKDNWVIAPASTTSRDGLGPMINTASCLSCHPADGRGAPPINGEQPLSLIFKLGRNTTDFHGTQLEDENYGGQFNNATIIGVDKEGDVAIQYEELKGYFDDGEEYSLRKPTYSFTNLNYGSFNGDTKASPRIARQLPGLGLLETITEATILNFADENDSNVDGISGRANYVWDYISNKTTLGRFGWKASQPSIKQFVAEAFKIDMGLTTSIFEFENITASQLLKYPNIPNGGTPEVTDKVLNQVSFYITSLAVPARRNWTDETVLEGEKLFTGAGCYKCHKPEITTGTHPTISQLSNQKIRPYTDMLLHDMGNGLADEKEEFIAKGNEWRTPPLWGIGMIKTVNNHTFLLHDGRARNLSEAILWHGGEAENAKNIYKSMSKTQRAALIKFLESL